MSKAICQRIEDIRIERLEESKKECDSKHRKARRFQVRQDLIGYVLK